jgi:MOSC domain-containing protein YiiM
MIEGVLISIYIMESAGKPLVSMPQTRAIAGRGLEGDRYFKKIGTYSNTPGPGREVTLVEIEAIEALKRECGIEITPGSARRNLVTKGVALNHLVGREFSVGESKLRGVRLCEPCSYLESLTSAGVKDALIHRGGLRADIIKDGTLRIGDRIQAL